jgi:hypothetical protein
MKLLSVASFGLLASSFVGAFQLPSGSHAAPRSATQVESTRKDFLSTSASAVAGAILVNSQPAYARGRATLEQAYDRYTPRIIEGGKFYKNDLYGAIAKGDWKGLEAATQEPPKKSKEDRTLQDGGVAKRAAQAGGFSNARVLAAMELYAGTFSDSSITQKTKTMKAEVETLKEVVEGMNKAAKIALGEESAGGGLFGIGGKKLSKQELSKQVQELYIKGGNAYNAYIFAANDGLPIQLNKLPFL